MQLQWDKTQIPLLRRKVWEVQNQEQTLEVRLAEDMPDIGHIICGWGQSVLRGKEWRADCMSISGGVMAWILYAPEDGSAPRSVEAWLPFNMKWNFPPSQRDGVIQTNISLHGVNARVLSARKMMVRAAVSALGEGLEPTSVDHYVPGKAEDGIQLLKMSYPVRVLVEAGEKYITIDEDAVFSAGKPQKLVSCMVNPRLSEQKVVGGKAVFRGDCEIHTVFMGEDAQLHSEDFSVPFAQYADLDKDYDKEAQVTAMPAVSNLEPELLEDGVRVKCGFVVQYGILDAYLLDVAQDAYSLTHQVAADLQELNVPAVLDKRLERREIAQSAPGEFTRIVEHSCLLEQPMTHRNGMQIDVQIPGMVQVLCQDDKGDYAAVHVRFTDAWSVPAGEDTDVTVTASPVAGASVSADGENITVRGAVDTQLTALAEQSIPMIAGIDVGEKLTEDPNRPSMILRRVGEESLWELAKNYGSTVDAIRKANTIEDVASSGQLLLIPVN